MHANMIKKYNVHLHAVVQ